MTQETEQLRQGPPTEDVPAGAPDPDPEPAAKPNRLNRRPASTAGVYMVLVADAAIDPETGKPKVKLKEAGYRELGWYRGHGHGHVRRQVVEDVQEKRIETELSLARGIWIRPVPAESWPNLEQPTGYQVERKLVV